MTQAIAPQTHWTLADLERLDQDNWQRYEIVDGELFVTRAPHWGHQRAAGNIHAELYIWSRAQGLGEVVEVPGIIFSDADHVIPDVVWISQERLAALLDDQGHLTGAPELIVEILSLGAANEYRDLEAKLQLYSAQGVQEYWVGNWKFKQVTVYRREGGQLQQAEILLPEDDLRSPLLPGFCCRVQQIFGDDIELKGKAKL